MRIDALQNTFGGSISGDARVVTLVPNLTLLPPPPFPGIRIVSVGGVSVPAHPQGSFNPVDVTIDTAQAAVIALEGQNIPPSITIDVTVVNETEGLQVVSSSPLSGTAQLSTANATVVVPSGFSRLFTHAKW